MSASRPLFQEKSPHMLIRLNEDLNTNTAQVRLTSRHSDEGIKTWSRESASERDALLEELRKRFGVTHVHMDRADGENTTDRVITVTAPSVDDMNHVPQVMAVLEGFVMDRKADAKNKKEASADGMEALMRALRRPPKTGHGGLGS